MDKCWIPDFVEYDSEREWKEYDELLYSIFESDFILDHPLYDGKEVRVRFEPYLDGREEAFWHLTCVDFDHKSGKPEDREVDPERCKRIKWPRSFIENHDECVDHKVDECKGVLVWEAPHKYKGRAKKRVKLFLDEESYLVVLEPRGQYCFLITAFYVDKEYTYKSIMREAKRNGAKIAGRAC